MALWIIAKNTYREIIRDRILYGLLVFAILLIGFSLALGQLSFAEQARISVNFGLVGIHLSSFVLSVFVGSTLVSKELEKQTILTLLARPISRTQFLWGKFIGLSSVILTVVTGLSLILAIIMFFLEFTPTMTYLVSLWGIFIESWIMLSLTMLFGMLTRPLLTVCFSIGLFLIGHWQKDLQYFAMKSKSLLFSSFANTTSYIIPDLERLNWKSAVTYSEHVSSAEILFSSLYGFCWVLLFISAAGLLFRRKDFV